MPISPGCRIPIRCDVMAAPPLLVNGDYPLDWNMCCAAIGTRKERPRLFHAKTQRHKDLCGFAPLRDVPNRYPWDDFYVRVPYRQTVYTRILRLAPIAAHVI